MAESTDDTVQRATAIAMDRYDISEPGALAFLTRLARRGKVDVRVIALAVIAAAVARRARLGLLPLPRVGPGLAHDRTQWDGSRPPGAPPR